MDTLVSMRVFRRVVELESFVAAATRMNISPAMTSKHVMHLERHLGARLLNRSSRHLSLTEIGKVYFEQCRDVLDNLDQAEAAVSHTAVVPCGVLKISAPVWCANRLFTKALADYRATYPEVTLDVDLSGRMVNLVEEGFDLALRASRTLDDNLIARPITPFRFQLVGAPAYLARAGRPSRAAELERHAMITYSLVSFESGIPVNGPHGEETVKMNSVLKTNNESLMHDAALDGMGLALLPSWLVEEDIAAARLERLMPAYEWFAGQLYAVYTSRRYLLPKVRTFVDFIAEKGRLG